MSADPRWPSARALFGTGVRGDRPSAALVGIPTYTTSITPRSATSTPQAIRAALERFTAFSLLDEIDLAEVLDVVDYGDADRPDGPDGADRVRQLLAQVDPRIDLLVALGGDNAMTFTTMATLADGDLGSWGLITLDAHLDLRGGASNGSVVRQLLDAGLDGRHVVQVGLGDFSNSAPYARDARDAGITIVPRHTLRRASLDTALTRALTIAGSSDRPVYVDVDLDVADRAVVPGCPAAAPGGLSADEVREAVRVLASDPRVRAIDVTEVDVDRDAPDQRTVRLAALLVLEALAGLARRAP